MPREQRKQRRIRVDLPVHVTLLNSSEKRGESVGKLRDLSKGGCCFHLEHDIPVGNRVVLRIGLNEALSKKLEKQELTARGAVCRIQREEDGYLLSVRFLK